MAAMPVKINGAEKMVLHMIGNMVVTPENPPGILPYANSLAGDHPVPPPYNPPILDRFHSNEAGQDNLHEGIYIDDIIVGFAEHGEMVTGQTAVDTTFVNVVPQPTKLIPAGDYTLQIRRGPSYGEIYYPPNFPPTQKYRVLALTNSWNANARMSDSISLVVPAASNIGSGQTFTISDPVNTVTFQFLLPSQTLGDPSYVAIPYTGTEDAGTMANDLVTAINNEYQGGVFTVTAADNNAPRVDLFGAVGASAGLDPQSGGPSAIQVVTFGTEGSFVDSAVVPVDLDPGVPGFIPPDTIPASKVPADMNTVQAQGEVIISSDMISDSANWGILVEPGPRTREPTAAPGAGRRSRRGQPAGAGGRITLMNNVAAYNGSGGIQISGDSDPAGEPVAAVPFVRVINNTIYGTGSQADTGIQVQQNASPTLLNDIVANLGIGVSVDGTCGTTVVGAMLYQNNGVNTVGIGGLGSNFPIPLNAGDPLFVDPTRLNFYLKEGSQAIDSSVDPLQDRTSMISVEQPLGIGTSPIIRRIWTSLDNCGWTIRASRRRPAWAIISTRIAARSSTPTSSVPPPTWSKARPNCPKTRPSWARLSPRSTCNCRTAAARASIPTASPRAWSR